MTTKPIAPVLSDAECRAIYYQRALAIGRGERPGSGNDIERDCDLIRAGYAG